MSGAGAVACYVALGSNLDHPRQQVRGAVEALGRLPQSRLEAVSQLHASRPLGPSDQPDYCNAVARLATTLAPMALLERLQEIEVAHGRRREVHWGPRTLDLDLILYGGLQMHSALLQLPHPGLSTRDFVLYPLAEIAPHDLEVPGLGRLQELLEGCPRHHLIAHS